MRRERWGAAVAPDPQCLHRSRRREGFGKEGPAKHGERRDTASEFSPWEALAGAGGCIGGRGGGEWAKGAGRLCG